MKSEPDSPKVVWVLGAGFSKAAGMPLATELLDLLLEELYNDDELRGWLQSLAKILGGLRHSKDTYGLRVNIEQVFHYG